MVVVLRMLGEGFVVVVVVMDVPVLEQRKLFPAPTSPCNPHGTPDIQPTSYLMIVLVKEHFVMAAGVLVLL